MVAVTGAIVLPGKANRRSHMNIEMSKREELSDAELDGVTGGGVGHAIFVAAWYAADAVVQVIHDVAQGIADATK